MFRQVEQFNNYAILTFAAALLFQLERRKKVSLFVTSLARHFYRFFFSVGRLLDHFGFRRLKLNKQKSRLMLSSLGKKSLTMRGDSKPQKYKTFLVYLGLEILTFLPPSEKEVKTRL